MTPAAIQKALEAVIAASPGGALAVPVPAAAGLPAGIAGRLELVGRLLSPTGTMTVVGPTVTRTAVDVSVHGRTSAFGAADLAVEMSLGPGDALAVKLALDPGAPAPLHEALSWTALVVGLSAADGATDVTATLTGELSVAGRAVPVALGHFAAGPPTTWTLKAATGTGTGGGLSLADLTGVDSEALAELAGHLPGAATVAHVTTELTLVTSGGDPRLAFAIPFVATVSVGPAGFTMATTVLTPMIRLPLGPGDDPEAAFEVAGSITALGTTQSGSIRLTPAPAGFELRVVLTPGPGSVLTVDGLSWAVLGRAPDDVLAAVPAGLRARLASSGFTDLEVIAGPLPGAIGFAGAGTFLGWTARGEVRTWPWLGATAVSVWLLLDEDPATLSDVVDGLGIDIPDAVYDHLPTVAVGLRELRYEPSAAVFEVGGVLAAKGWALDVRVGLGVAGSVSFEVGRLYAVDSARSLPTLTQLLDALLPSSPHNELLDAIEQAVPDELNTLLSATTVHHAEVSWSPGSAKSPSSLAIDLVVAFAASAGGDPVVATLAASHTGAIAGGEATWRVQLTTPFLRADVVDIATMFGLPVSRLGLTQGELELACQSIDVGPDGVDLSFEVEVEGSPAWLEARVRRANKAWEWDLGLTVGELRFELEVTANPTTFRATLTEQGAGLRVADLARLLGIDDVPGVLDLALAKAEIRFVPSASGVGLSASITAPHVSLDAQLATRELARTPPVRAWALSAAVPSAHFGLDGIPILGRLIPDPSALAVDITGLALTYSNLDLTAAELALVTSLLTGSTIGTPGTALGRGLTLGGTLKIAGTTVSVSPQPPAALPPPAPSAAAPPPAVAPGQPVGVARAADSRLTWKAVGASLGPVHIATVGIGYGDGRLLLGVTGSLGLSVLELTLVGLRVEVPMAALTDPSRIGDTTFALDGVGIQLHSPGITVGGALVHTGDRLDGAALVSAQGTSISLLASLTRTAAGEPSLFMYGVLNREIGGPAFFFVTGLAAGFGYNRGFVEPAIEAVADFPLVKSALGHGKEPDSVSELIEMLATPGTGQAFPAEDGAMFLAAGVKFTSFKVVESFVMLAVVLGTHQTTILVLGTSRLQLPPTLPDTMPPTPPVPPLAVINLNLRAKYEVERGRLEVLGQLVGSYILSHACTLTGGFAVLAHFKDDPVTGAQAGDFVVTVGGYHPHFDPPRWYPVVPRLTLAWRVDDNLYVKGSAYFAITPGAAMAGGSLDAAWDRGGLSARFSLAADFLVQWRPYHYEASFGIGVRGSLRWGALELSVNVHADVRLYGPPFGGTATLDLGVVSKTVEFGAGRPARVPLPVADFPASFLPGPAEVCGATLRSGALGQDRDSGIWMVAPNRVEISIHTAVPVTGASMGVAALAALSAAGAPAVGSVPVDVSGRPIVGAVALAPCEASATAPMAFAVVRHHGGAEVDVSDHFDPVPTFKQLPVALWNHAGPPAPPPPPGSPPPPPPVTVNALAGFVLASRQSTPAPETALLPLAHLTTERLDESDEATGASLRVTLRRLAVGTPSTRQEVLAALGLDPATTPPAVRPTRAAAVSNLAAAAGTQ